jgi:hypothetical protein
VESRYKMDVNCEMNNDICLSCGFETSQGMHDR